MALSLFARRALAVSLLLVAVVLVYLPGLGGDFVFDDYPNIVQNPRVHAESLDLESLKRAAQAYQPGIYGRPLATIGFAVDHVIGGKDATAFKVHSLLVHLLNVVLVWLLVRRLFEARDAGRVAHYLPAAVALAWSIHPIQVSTVLYVVQRMEMLVTTFILLGLLAYLRGRRLQQASVAGGWAWIAASGALAGLGMLAKESAALFPLLTLGLELTVLRFMGPERDVRILRVGYAAVVTLGIAVFLAVLVPRFGDPTQYAGRDFTAGERVLTQLRVLPMYLGQMLLPLPDSLTFYYDQYPKSTGLLSPWTTLAGGVFLAVLAAAAWIGRRRMPIFALGVFWFFGAHALTSNVIPLEMVFEHRNYFALLGVLLAMADLLGAVAERLQLAHGRLMVGVAILGFGVLALLRTATWGDPLLLATDLAQRNPQSARASSELATIYSGLAGGNPDTPFFRFAMIEFERGSRLANASPLPEQGLILMAASTGQTVDPAWWDRIDEKLRQRPIGPQELMAVTGLVTQRLKGIPLDDERLSQTMQLLLHRALPNPALHALFARYLLELDDQENAGLQFAQAVLRSPDGDGYAERIQTALLEDGHARAVAALREALDLPPVTGSETATPPPALDNERPVTEEPAEG